VFPSRLLFQDLENLFEAQHLFLRLFKMCHKKGLQLRILGAFGELWKRFDELVLRAIHIPEFID
jgi:hypothetical protein